MGTKPHEFTKRLAFYMGEINAVHPFREGNGRVQRLFSSQLALNAGYFIDFESVGQDQMYIAMNAQQGRTSRHDWLAEQVWLDAAVVNTQANAAVGLPEPLQSATLLATNLVHFLLQK